MSRILLPELRIARGTSPLLNPENAANHDIAPGCPYQELIATYGRHAVARYQYVGAVTARVSVEPLYGRMLGTWDQLASTTYDMLADKLPVAIAEEQRELSFLDLDLAKEAMFKDARGGSAQIAAFLEVVPRVLFRNDYDEPNDELANTAANSKGLMLRWSKLTANNDARLSYGLAYPKPNVNSNDPYDGLRFHTKWFEERGTAIGIRSEKLPHVRGESGDVLERSSSGPILGCPAALLIPRLFDAMLACAHANNLFAATYEEERRNHGYTDSSLT